MLEKTSEWSLISSIEKDAIMESLDNSAVKKIIQITLAVNLMDLAVNLTAGGMSISEIMSGDIAMSSPAVMAYFGKWLIAPLIAYLYWKKDKVKNKTLKASTLSVPLVGAVAFPVLTLKDHSHFLKFWKIYNKTKKSFRAFIDENDEGKRMEKEQVFRELIEKKLAKQHTPNDYRKRMLNIVQAQGFDVEETKHADLVSIKEEDE